MGEKSMMSAFPCRLCKTIFDIPEDLGRHLITEHGFSNFLAQSEVAVLVNNGVAKCINEEYSGFWIHDSFIVKEEKHSG